MLRRLAKKFLGKEEKKADKKPVSPKGAKGSAAKEHSQRSAPKKGRRPRPQRDMHARDEHPVDREKQEKPVVSAKPLQGIFKDLIPELQKAISMKGYSEPTPIQAEAMPHLMLFSKIRTIYLADRTDPGNDLHTMPDSQQLLSDCTTHDSPRCLSGT